MASRAHTSIASGQGRDRRQAYRRGLMAYGSASAIALALAVAGGASDAQAQVIAPRVNPNTSAQGTPTFAQGTGTITRGANADTIDLDTPATIINWDTFDTNLLINDPSYVNFLPQGTTLTFNGPGQAQDFTVLNRIFPATQGNSPVPRGVALSGLVESFIDPGVVGGNVWFYSPGGILLGNGAAFNVGSLLLTTSNVNDTNSFVSFLGVDDPNTSVIIDGGASISLTNEDSYLVVFAPSIEQRGTVSVNGGVTYALGEQGFSFLDSSPFVSVSTPAAPGNSLIHTGTTTGPASRNDPVNGIFDPHSIVFRAEGTGLTMLLEGAIGYQPATGASVDSNGSIQLFGTDISNNGNLALTSNTTVAADTVSFLAGNGEAITMGGDAFENYALDISSADTTFGAAAGGAVDIAGSVTITQRGSPGDAVAQLTVAGDPGNVLPNGTVNVGGDLTIQLRAGRFPSTIADQTGGSITGSVSDGGQLTVGGNLVLDATAEAENIFPDPSFAQGGSVVFGISGATSAVTVTGDMVLDASARQYVERFQCEGPCGDPPGGDAIGGSATLSATGGTLSVGNLRVEADAEAQDAFDPNSPAVNTGSGDSFDALAGSALASFTNTAFTAGTVDVSATAKAGIPALDQTGGTAEGGTADLLVGPGTSATIGAINIFADASGTAGGNGSAQGGPASFDGGDAVGGAATLRADVSITGLATLNMGASATGGNGATEFQGIGASGGFGGEAVGGTIAIDVVGAGTSLGAPTGTLNASALAGDGGAGGDALQLPPGDGGNGGNAFGGGISMVANGAGASIDASGLIVSADAFGGAGGAGGSDANLINAGGVGGDGGHALVVGNLIEIIASDAASIVVPGSLVQTTSGGDGGDGGDGSVNGAGGDGGTAVASADIKLGAQGGSLSAISGVNISTRGLGGVGGRSGTAAGAPLSGLGGDGTGANVAIDASDFNGNAGSVDFAGFTSVLVEGSGALGAVNGTGTTGSVRISDLSTLGGGDLSFGGLDVQTLGLAPGAAPVVLIESSDGTISAQTDVFISLDDGDLQFTFDGTGQLVETAGTGIQIVANTGSVFLTHTNNPGIASLSAGQDLTALAALDIIAGPGSSLLAGNLLDLDAGGNIDVADVSAGFQVNLFADGDVAVVNASQTGPVSVIDQGNGPQAINGIEIRAGRGAIDSLSTNPPFDTYFWDPASDVTVGGTLTSTGDVIVQGGGSVTFQAGGGIAADNAAYVRSGDDIVAGATTSFVTGLNPVLATDASPGSFGGPDLQPGELQLLAGGIQPGQLESVSFTPFASLVLAGTLDSNGGPMVLRGDAIDATGAIISSGAFTAEIDNLVSTPGDDSGLLVNGCLDGDICIGALDAVGDVAIGTGAITPDFVRIGQLDVTAAGPGAGADTIDIFANGLMLIGNGTTAGSASAASAINLVNFGSDIVVDNTAFDAPTVIVDASGGSLQGTGIFSGVDIGIDVGLDLFANSISATNLLSSISDVGSPSGLPYTVPGTFDVVTLFQGGGNINIQAGDIFIGSADAGGNSIILDASGSVSLGATAANTFQIDLSGSDVAYGQLLANDSISVVSTVGGITAFGAAQIDTLGPVTLDSATDLSIGTVSAGGVIDLIANGAVTFTDLFTTSGSIRITNGGDVTGNSIISTNSGNGGILDRINIQSGGAVNVSQLSAGDGLFVTAASLTADTAFARNRIQISTTGATNIGDATSTGDLLGTNAFIDITASDITLGSAFADNFIDLTATTGGLLLGDLVAGDGSTLVAATSIDLQSLSVTGIGDVSLMAGTTIDFAAISTTQGSITLDGPGGVTGGTLTSADSAADDTITVTSSAGISLGNGASGDAIVLSGTDVTTGTLDAVAGIGVSAGGIADLGVFTAGQLVDVSASDILLDGGVAGALRLDAAGGDLVSTGDLAANGFADLDAAGAIAIQGLSAAGPVTLDAGGAIGFTDISTTSGRIDITSGTSTITGTSLATGDTAGDDGIALTAPGSISVGTIASGDDIQVGAASFASNSVTALGSIGVDVPGALQIGAANAGTTLSLTGASVTLGDGISGGDATLVATSGPVDIGTLVAGGLLSVDSPTAINFAALQGGGIALTAGDAINGGTASATGDISLDGAIVTTAALDAGGAITVLSGSTVDIAAANGAGGVDISGTSVALGSASSAGPITVTASSGDITGTGLYDASAGTGDVTLDAAGGIAIGTVLGNGNIDLDAVQDAQFAELRTGNGLLTVDAGGSILGSSVASTGSLDPAGDDSVVLNAGGDIVLDGTANVFNQATQAQDSITAIAGGTLAIAALDAGNAILIDATGTPQIGTFTSGGDTSITSDSVALDAGNVGGTLLVNATAGDITGTGTVTAGGGIGLSATGNIDLGTLEALGGDLFASAGGSVALANGSASGIIDLEGTSIAVTGALVAGDDIDLAANGPVTVGSLASGGDISVEADGAFTAGSASAPSGVVEITAGGAIGLDALTAASGQFVAGGAIDIASASVTGLLALSGTDIAVAAPGALNAIAQASAGNIILTAGGDLTVEDATATGDIALTSTGGSVTVATASAGLLTLPPGVRQPQQVTSSGGSIGVSAANDILVLDNVVSATSLDMNAGGLVSISAAIEGQTVAITAGDLAIGPDGSIGSAIRTQSVSIASTGDLALGGDPGSAGFVLDGDELARIFSVGDLAIAASALGTLNVRDVTFAAGSQFAQGGTLALSGGIVDVDGALSVDGANSDTNVALTAFDTLDFDYEDASVSVQDASGAGTGNLTLSGNQILFLSDDALSDIESGSVTADNRLAVVEAARPEGLIQAGDVRLEATDRILMQNTGAGERTFERRGFESGSLTIAGAQDGSTLVVINGRIGTASGRDAVEQGTYETGFTSDSTFNGCSFTAVGTCDQIERAVEMLPEVLPPVQDVIEQEVEEAEEVEEALNESEDPDGAMLVDLSNIDDPAGAPLIDDPVTGAGNEDLWQVPDE